MSPQASNSAALLRMLEPAVRPVSGSSGSVPGVSFEQQSFQTLLSTAQDGDAVHGSSGNSQKISDSISHNPLSDLAGTTRIENQSLRNLIAQNNKSAADG